MVSDCIRVWLITVYWPSSYLPPVIAEEPRRLLTSNNLGSFNTHPRYVHAKFRPDPRYKNVQVDIVDTGFTPRVARAQLDQPG